jgi:murein DD-endopeptidase MepM/ murein hydrolase activator NlpD
VQEGQRVRRGDVLGRIGSTGRSTGPHLHWALSLMRNGAETRLDPELLVPAKVNGRTP